VNDLEITTDGRTPAYTDIGEQAAVRLLLSRCADEPPAPRLREERIYAEGVPVISPDRPGYGGRRRSGAGRCSTGPATLLLWPTRWASSGSSSPAHSSGAPYGVASAALLSERVSAGILLGGVTDMGWPPRRHTKHPLT